MLNCKDTNRLISRSLDERLPWRDRCAVRLHLLICKACTRFEQQMRWLQRAARRYLQRGAFESDDVRLSPEARARLQRAIADHRE